ncbi:hypothetical protein SAMN02927900_02672 [Rhizobium mongolense subsp. loessense]|uniref:Uncharacterized protein n=1 Tax=Rhizobium mongolense subsp. loessense TaxID=158890 RepID=A0A1G4RGY1_9HYPH|nr:hypothetical protein SAMN02927900_02672 [Rhizobium mongolense subsp. loessense]
MPRVRRWQRPSAHSNRRLTVSRRNWPFTLYCANFEAVRTAQLIPFEETLGATLPKLDCPVLRPGEIRIAQTVEISRPIFPAPYSIQLWLQLWFKRSPLKSVGVKPGRNPAFSNRIREKHHEPADQGAASTTQRRRHADPLQHHQLRCGPAGLGHIPVPCPQRLDRGHPQPQ